MNDVLAGVLTVLQSIVAISVLAAFWQARKAAQAAAEVKRVAEVLLEKTKAKDAAGEKDRLTG